DDSSSETSEETEIDEDSSSDAEEVIEEPSETEEIVELPEVENNGSIVEVIEPIIEENITEEIVLDNVTSEVTVNETIVEGVIPENVTFIDENLTELNETVELIENLTLNETIEESLWQRFDFNEVCADSCLLPEGLNSTEYALVFEVEGEIIFNVDSATYLVQNLTTIEQSVDVALNITDSYGELVDAYVTIYDDHSTIESGHSGDIVKFASGYYDVVINPKVMSFSGDTHPVKSITFAGTDLTETTTELAGFEYVETVTSPDFVQQYAIDPRVQFASAKAIITANSSELYRCDSWNFLEQICLDGWTKVRSIVPGEDYEVELLGTQSFAEGYNVTNVSYLKIKEDIRYDAIIDSIVKDDETNDLTVKFHHDSSKPLPIFIKGNVEYLLDKKTSSADENITLTVFNWNDERFRILVGAHTEAFEFGTAKNVDFTTVVRDASGSEIDATIELIDSLTDEVKASKNHGQAKKILKEGEYNIKTKLNNHPVQEIEYRDLTIYEDFTADIKIDDVPEFDNYVEVYAIDPTNLNFTNATVTVTATGTELYKCKDWNFATQTCFGTWSLFKSDLIPGQDYTFILTPDDPGFAETVSTCAAEDEAIKGSFGGTCDQTDGSSLETNGGTTETHTYTKGTYAGVRIQSVDTGITNCQSVDEVFFCYEWWSTQVQSAPTDCDISIDANAGASYTAVTTTCPGTTTDPGIICTNVTSLETWTCANFFGASGTRAYAKSELSRPTAGKGSTETATWDVFYFNVTYTESDTSPPASVTNLQNESQDIASIYWTWTNPVDADFNETIIYINGTNVINTTNAFYNATGLDDNTNYTITVHTKDHAGNINNTDVNNTASTTSCGIWINTLDDSPDPVTQGENITFTVNVTSLGTVDTVLLNFDGVNYTMNPDSQDIWTYIYDTTSLSATTYNYYINANCSLGFNAYEKNGTFTVQLGQASVNITDILITPDDDELTAGFQINPVEDNNVTVTLVANITNTTAIDSCEVRIYNASDSYISPTLNIATGIIQTTGTQTQCNTSWNMDYFRNPGDWSVTLDVNLTDSNSDQENSSYYYNTLIAHELSISTVSFSGLPLETVNSSDAYPMYIRNTGNSLVNISLSGSDFIGQTNSSYSIGVGNATYNETATGTYTELATTYQEIYKLSVQQTKEIYFRGYIPSGTISQNYQSTINIRSD
ncbi:MAG: hypothetical protein U9R08_04635, partial [Nanoarchaeota archaeon]|nr:hypothetical protein [Nanoarchaeota archaeon]